MSADPNSTPVLAGLVESLTPKAQRAVAGAGGPSPRFILPADALGSRSLRGRAPASTIDHTLLKPGSTPAQVQRLCAEAVEYGSAEVCSNAGLLPRAAAALAGTPVKPAATVGLPLGATTAQVKAFEAQQAVQAGAGEIDRVIDLGALKAGVDFIKTCTGFSGGGATAEDIAWMRRVVGPVIGVKASGGIRPCRRPRL